jgi:hypothetical protein
VDHVLADQFLENIVIKPDAVLSAGTFNVLEVIDLGIPGVTHCAIPKFSISCRGQVAIEHIGSTAVPDVGGKPVIDVMVVCLS